MVPRRITNKDPDHPLVNVFGQVLANVAVEFLLVNRWGKRADSFDVDGEYVSAGPYTAITDEGGLFDIELVATSTMQDERYYQVTVKAPGCMPFRAPLTAGAEPLSLILFRNGGIAPRAAEFSAFAAHIQNLLIHHTHANLTTLDKLSEAGGVLLFDGNEIQGNGSSIVTTLRTSNGEYIEATTIDNGDGTYSIEWHVVEAPSGTVSTTIQATTGETLQPTINGANEIVWEVV